MMRGNESRDYGVDSLAEQSIDEAMGSARGMNTSRAGKENVDGDGNEANLQNWTGNKSDSLKAILEFLTDPKTSKKSVK